MNKYDLAALEIFGVLCLIDFVAFLILVLIYKYYRRKSKKAEQRDKAIRDSIRQEKLEEEFWRQYEDIYDDFENDGPESWKARRGQFPSTPHSPWRLGSLDDGLSNRDGVV